MGRAGAWTQYELDYLRKNYPKYHTSIGDIAGHLGRSENAIKVRASRIGVKRPVFIDPIESWGPGAYELLKCYGLEFRADCVDSCPGWLKCMEIYTEKRVNEAFNLKGNRGTVSGNMTGPELVRAIRQAAKNLDQCEVIE